MEQPNPTTRGAIVLCGGASSRMGSDKAWLRWGDQGTMLQHVVGILQDAVPTENILVVPGRGKRIPALPAGVRVVGESSKTAGAGPLAALMSGLACCEPPIEATFACSCDAPLIKPAFVKKLLGLINDDADVVVPSDDERLYPLAAAYRRNCVIPLYNAFSRGDRSLHRLIRSGALRVRDVSVDELRAVDPALDSLVNCNTPEEYESALARAGITN